MQNSNGGLFFSAEIDTDKFKKAADDMKKELQSVASAADIESKRIDKIFTNVGQSRELKQMFEDISRAGRGAFVEISERAQQLVKEIQGDIVQLSQLEKVQGALNDEYEAGKISLEDYISAQARLAVLHDTLSESIRTNEQALRNERQMLELSGDSMVAMQSQIAQLTTAYMKLSQAEREGTEGQAILKNLADVQSRLQNATTAMNKYAGAATKQFNGLNFSLQQIVRELPSLAMGPQMFFMAISNNLPMFTDELARARKENEALQASGQKGVPVWKQVAKSLFSWQTALVAGITILITHGDQIGKWITQLFTGKEAVDDVTTALNSMRKAVDFKSAGSQIAEFERLAEIYREIGDNAEEKQKFIVKYKDEIKNTGLSITSVTDAENAFIDNSDAFIESIQQRAMALAGQKLAEEQFTKAIEQRLKDENELRDAEKELQRLNSLPDDYKTTTVVVGSDSGLTQTKQDLIDVEKQHIAIIKRRSEVFEETGRTFIRVSKDMQKESEKTLKNAGIDTGGDDGGDEDINAIKQRQAQITALMNRNAAERIRMQVDLENQVEQARIDAMSDSYEKSEAQRRLDNKKELQALAQQKQEYIDAVVQGEKEVFDAREDARAQQDKNYVKQVFDPATVKVDTSLFDELESQIRAGQMKSIKDSLNDILKEFETYEQARLRIQEEYAEKRKMLMNEDGSLKEGVTQGNIDELARQEQKSIEAISMTFAMRDEAFEQWSSSLAGKTADALELMLAEAEEALSILENTEMADPEDMARATAEIVKLREALKKAREENDKSNKDAEDSKVTWADLNNVLKDSADIFTELGDKIPGVAGEILSGIGNIATSAVSIANAIKGIGEAVSAAEKASAILTVISTAIKALSFVANGWKESQEANEAATQAAWEYAEALEQIQINSRLDKYDTIFGQNAFGEMQENVEIIKDMRENINKLFLDAQKARPDQAFTREFIEGIGDLGNMPDLSKYYVSITSDLRSGWQKFWGSGKDNIHNFNLGNYIREDGTVMVEELQAMYNANADGMQEADKRLVEGLIKDGQILNDAMESVASYCKSLFNDVSGTIADSMISAFEETGDAANATFDDIRNNIAKNFAKNAIVDLFSKIFDEEAQSKMSALIADGDNEGAMNYLDQLIAETERLAPIVNETLKGLDVKTNPAEEDQEDDRTSASKGIAQASQDSVDELNGRATAIQSHTFSISNDMKTLVNTSAMMLDRLAGIESNTAHLEMIDSNIASLNKEMGNLRSDLTMRGIKLAR